MEQATALEIKALVETPTEAKAPRKQYTQVFIGGLQVAEVGLQKVGQERKEAAHYAHQHEQGYGKLDQAYKCRVCGKEVPYEERARVVFAEKQAEDSPLFVGATPKPEKAELEQGIVVEGAGARTFPEQVKEMYWVVPKRFKTKKEKAKDQANVNAAWTLCQAQGLKCRFKGRPAVWTGPLLYVMWGEDELLPRPDHAFPNAVKVDGIAAQLSAMNKEVAALVSV